MKKIAILTSGEGRITRRLASLFNRGDSIRVDLVLSDQVPDKIIDEMMARGINAVSLPRIIWDSNPAEIIKMIDDSGAELIVLDDFKGGLPAEIAAKYEGRIVVPETEEAAPHDVLAAIDRMDGSESLSGDGDAESCAPEPEVKPGPEVKTVDEEWAETLKIKFDQQQAYQTPPPIPGGAAPINHHSTAPLNPPSGGRFDAYGSHGYHGYHGYQGSQGYMGYQGSQGYQNGEAMPSTYLIWSILCTIFCCFVPGIVAIIFSSQVSSKYFAGDLAGAQRASRNAEIWIIVSFVLGVLTATLYLPIMMLT